MNTQLKCKKAEIQDLHKIIELLADDELGRKRERLEDPLPESYIKAFNAIQGDPNNELILAVLAEEIVGVLQITFTPYLTYQGGWRATIEGVRTNKFLRGKGIGTQMIEWAIHLAKERGAHVVQLTTDKQRPEALEFYKRLGFRASHEGLKLHLG
ncbi:GNAT family N-acetyltransferase [Virgibacillus halodenitrificans]|uniref:GNAT family N-acetyltransferase n=1 Tax=Virgibacillus halodenitrificans TaxID=1482 RepID=A0ABR7VQA4_VIRHA|nr:GNAT family N-acetyltransferase [Virgibacillus halodenitrificans]MBD1223506.1 GNAT family N-acetyltransferase [Virgibacillus halodenitrificans]MYL46143.1 GNAT family N-acetyltransferase [Virgibacillus halodenitrificans]CDQ31678.1 aminoalkylphosphonic acid N-acetyltransferase [Virgibacillus halodenitrificans]